MSSIAKFARWLAPLLLFWITAVAQAEDPPTTTPTPAPAVEIPLFPDSPVTAVSSLLCQGQRNPPVYLPLIQRS